MEQWIQTQDQMKSTNGKQNIDILYLLNQFPFLSKETLVLMDNQNYWRMNIIIHKNLLDYIHDNNLMINIIFKNEYRYEKRLCSDLKFSQNIEDSEFVSYSFSCKRPISYENIYKIYIELEDCEHHMFDIILFKNNLINKKVFTNKSCYDMYTIGLNKFTEQEFTNIGHYVYIILMICQ